jgi:hypothetical protein
MTMVAMMTMMAMPGGSGCGGEGGGADNSGCAEGESDLAEHGGSPVSGSGVTGDVLITSCTWVVPGPHKVQSAFSTEPKRTSHPFFTPLAGKTPCLGALACPQPLEKRKLVAKHPGGSAANFRELA